MNPVALRLCSLPVIISAILVSIGGPLDAKEPAIKGQASAPWQISLTIREGHRVAKPITGRSPLSTGSSALPGLFSANPFSTTLPSITAVSPSLPTFVPSPTSSRLARGGFWEAGAAPTSGILNSLTRQAMIAGDSPGTSPIDFVDISAAMH